MLPDAVLRTLSGLQKWYPVGQLRRLRRIRHQHHIQYLTQNYRSNLSARRQSW